MKKLTNTFIACSFVTLVLTSCSGLTDDISEVEALDMGITMEGNGGEGGDPELPDEGK